MELRFNTMEQRQSLPGMPPTPARAVLLGTPGTHGKGAPTPSRGLPLSTPGTHGKGALRGGALPSSLVAESPVGADSF